MAILSGLTPDFQGHKIIVENTDPLPDPDAIIMKLSTEETKLGPAPPRLSSPRAPSSSAG
jgi:hypothetical protein